MKKCLVTLIATAVIGISSCSRDYCNSSSEEDFQTTANYLANSSDHKTYRDFRKNTHFDDTISERTLDALEKEYSKKSRLTKEDYYYILRKLDSSRNQKIPH